VHQVILIIQEQQIPAAAEFELDEARLLDEEEAGCELLDDRTLLLEDAGLLLCAEDEVDDDFDDLLLLKLTLSLLDDECLSLVTVMRVLLSPLFAMRASTACQTTGIKQISTNAPTNTQVKTVLPRVCLRRSIREKLPLSSRSSSNDLSQGLS